VPVPSLHAITWCFCSLPFADRNANRSRNRNRNRNRNRSRNRNRNTLTRRSCAGPRPITKAPNAGATGGCPLVKRG
jgi:hypothetical protein